MPIEIRELIIRAHVDPQGAAAAAGPPPVRQRPLPPAAITVDELVRILKDRQER